MSEDSQTASCQKPVTSLFYKPSLELSCVAWLARGPAESPAAVVVVFDHVADREAYRVDLLPFMGANPPVNYELEFALDDDGTLAAAVNNYDARDAGAMPIWASLADPTAHVVQFRLATQGIALRNGLAAVRGKTGDSYAVIDLQGSARNVFAYERAQDTGLDFDGVRVVWSQRTQVFTPGEGNALKYSVHNELYPVVARPEVPGGDATVGADGSSSLPVWCPSATTTCSGTLTLTPASNTQAARSKPLARRDFKVPARKLRSVRIVLSRGARETLKRKGALRVNAVVRLNKAGGATRGTQRIRLQRRSARPR